MSLKEKLVFVATDDEDYVLAVFEDVELCKEFCKSKELGWYEAPLLFKQKIQKEDKTELFEYEMFFKSEPDDFCKIDGWLPISTHKIPHPEKISEYIQSGLLRKLNPEPQD